MSRPMEQLSDAENQQASAESFGFFYGIMQRIAHDGW